MRGVNKVRSRLSGVAESPIRDGNGPIGSYSQLGRVEGSGSAWRNCEAAEGRPDGPRPAARSNRVCRARPGGRPDRVLGSLRKRQAAFDAPKVPVACSPAASLHSRASGDAHTSNRHPGPALAVQEGGLDVGSDEPGRALQYGMEPKGLPSLTHERGCQVGDVARVLRADGLSAERV